MSKHTTLAQANLYSGCTQGSHTPSKNLLELISQEPSGHCNVKLGEIPHTANLVIRRNALQKVGQPVRQVEPKLGVVKAFGWAWGSTVIQSHTEPGTTIQR